MVVNSTIAGLSRRIGWLCQAAKFARRIELWFEDVSELSLNFSSICKQLSTANGSIMLK